MQLNSKGWLFLIGILVAAYLANCFTPLRVSYDSIRYFALKETIEGSWPAEFGVQKDFLPYGYVLFLLTLSKLGILSAFTISFFHLLYLAGSLYFVCRIFTPTVNFIYLVLLTLLNWTVIKFTITPVSEMQFLFFSMGAIFFYHRFELTRKPAHAVLLAIFITAAVFTRVVGLLLPMAMAISYIIKHYSSFLVLLKAKAYAWIIMISAGIIAIFLMWQLKFITYLGYLTRPLTSDPKNFFTTNIRQHLVDWASIFLNSPVEKFRSFPYYQLIQLTYALAGIIFLWIIGKRIFNKRYAIPLQIRIYLVLYILLIFNWPFYEPRFWFPVLPLILAILLQPFKLGKPFYRYTPIAASWYCIAGILSIGYYTWLTFDKRAFALRHENGIYRTEYEWHYFRNVAPRSPFWYRDTSIFRKAQ